MLLKYEKELIYYGLVGFETKLDDTSQRLLLFSFLEGFFADEILFFCSSPLQVGMEEALSSADEYASAKDQTASSKSPSSVSCYQSASDCSCDWSRDASPERLCLKGHNKVRVRCFGFDGRQNLQSWPNPPPLTTWFVALEMNVKFD